MYTDKNVFGLTAKDRKIQNYDFHKIDHTFFVRFLETQTKHIYL